MVAVSAAPRRVLLLFPFRAQFRRILRSPQSV